MQLVERAVRALQRAAAIKCAFGAAMLACAAAALFATGGAKSTAHETTAAVEWPREWDGRALRPLALSEVELRFAAQFPGSLARMSDGQRQLVLRSVDEPTRMLHPAADCYRALGYRIEAARLETDAQARRWRCFVAVRGGVAVRVCERIVDADGVAFTDTSNWYWAALLGRSRGPWQAVTTAQPS